MAPNNDLLFQTDPLADFLRLIENARAKRARRLLILSGKPVVFRIGNDLLKVTNYNLHFNQTESLANVLLSPSDAQLLEKDGAVEFEFDIEKDNNSNGISSSGMNDHPIRINIFFGEGAHNVVVFLDSK